MLSDDYQEIPSTTNRYFLIVVEAQANDVVPNCSPLLTTTRIRLSHKKRTLQPFLEFQREVANSLLEFPIKEKSVSSGGRSELDQIGLSRKGVLVLAIA